MGPYRVNPGRLSVSRTFGDLEAKHPEVGGMPGVVVCDPDVFHIPYTPDLDFLFLGCDGIFDKLSTAHISTLLYATIHSFAHLSLPELCARCADTILLEAAKFQSIDNLSVVMIAFQGLQDYIHRLKGNEEQGKEVNKYDYEDELQDTG